MLLVPSVGHAMPLVCRSQYISLRGWPFVTSWHCDVVWRHISCNIFFATRRCVMRSFTCRSEWYRRNFSFLHLSQAMCLANVPAVVCTDENRCSSAAPKHQGLIDQLAYMIFSLKSMDSPSWSDNNGKSLPIITRQALILNNRAREARVLMHWHNPEPLLFFLFYDWLSYTAPTNGTP